MKIKLKHIQGFRGHVVSARSEGSTTTTLNFFFIISTKIVTPSIS